MSIRNPHDAFFRQIFSDPAVAADFLANYLPAEVRAELDLSHVEPQPDSFIDDDLREHFSDLLFRVSLRNGDTAFAYTLFEHKSQPERQVAFQLLRYMVRIWERTQRDDGSLPIILPIVVYHGEQPWRVPQSFGALFTGAEALRPYWPDFVYTLYDLSTFSDDELRGEVVLRVTLLALKTIFSRDAAARLPGILSLLYQGLTDRQRALEYLRTVLFYLTYNQHIEQEDVRVAIETISADESEDIMTSLAERWIEEGREEGREEGMSRIVLELLTRRFGSVDSELAQKIRGCSEEQLLALSGVLLEAVSLDEVEQFVDSSA